MNRQEIQNAISQRRKAIEALKEEIFKLWEQNMLLSDETYRFEEKEEDVVVKRRPKIIEKKLIGRRYWKAKFVDDDTGNVITIDRQEVVRINGEWV